MRVCHVHFGKFPFQTTPIPYEYAKNLVKLGINSTVLALAMNPGDTLSEQLNGVNIVRVPVWDSGRSMKSLLKFANCLNDQLIQQHYDVVHLYAFRGAGFLRLRCRHSTSKWLIHVITGSVFPGLHASLGNYLTKLECRLYDRIIANTENVGRHVLGDLAFYPIPLGVDFDRLGTVTHPILREELGYRKEDIISIYIGSLSRLRKLEVLLKGFALASRSCNRLRLFVIGSGDKKDFNQLIYKLDLLNTTHYQGLVPYNEVNNYLNMSDIGLAYVPATREYNPQPALKTLELLASGKPVLATDTQGNRFYVKDEYNALIVKDTPEDIATGLLRLATDDSLRKRLETTARSSVADYDWGKIVKDKLIPIYHQMTS